MPGVIYARRYRVHEGTSGYTTVYEFASTAVPDSAAWKEQQQHSSPHSPRMRQAMTHAPGSAGVYTRIDPSQAQRGCRRLLRCARLPHWHSGMVRASPWLNLRAFCGS
jgi:hypothetical protein